MRVVNLARRPFFNRRPIVRFAAVLWLAGVLLLLWNLRLYRNHWQGTTDNRRELAANQQTLAAERQALGQQARRLDAVDLPQRNRRSAFLNSLISYRTFPWSALFDDLEEVLPAEVKLFNIQPVVKLADELAQENRRAARRRAAAERAATSRRARAAQRRGTSADAQEAEPVPPPPAAPEPQLAPDEVALQLNGLAKSEDALVELVDRLFDDPLFRRPVLDSEFQDTNRNATVFSLFVVYLTHRQPLASPQVAEEGAAPGEDELADGELVAGGTAAEGGTLPRRPGEGAPAAGVDGVPETSDRGAPDRGAPDRGAPDRGAPDRGALDRADRIAAQTGTPGRGTPDRGAPGGVPGRGTPGQRFQAALRGTPGRGTPDSGTPAAAAAEAAAATADRSMPDAETADGGRTEPTADREVPDAETADRESETADRNREEDESETVPAEDDEEAGLGERDASATPAIDREGQVFLRPHLSRPGVFRDAGATDLAEAVA